MSGYDGRGRKFPLVIARGTDVAFELTVTDSAGAPVDMSSATIAGNIYTKAGTLVDTMTAAVSGAGSNVVTLSLSDTKTALLTSVAYQWSLLVTRGGDVRPWLAGGVTVVDPDTGGTGTSGNTAVSVDDDVNVAVTVNVGPKGDTGATGPGVDVLTTDGDLVTRASGVPARITRAALAADAAFADQYAPLTSFDVTTYGADPTGATDSYAAIMAADAACEAAGGGVVFFPAGTYRVDSQIVISSNGGSPVPKMKARRWIGVGAWASGKTINSNPNGGTIIDLRDSTLPGVFLNAEGLLHIEGITFTQLGTAHTQKMFVVTNTTAHFVGCGFFGHASKTATTADQDAIQFGVTTTTIDGTTDAPFQGYGSVVERCHFNKIQRGVYGRMYANALKVLHNTWWAQCGGSAAIEFDGGGDSVNYNVGGTIVGNLIECVGYVRAMAFDWVANFYIAGNDFYDDSAIDASGYMLIGNNCTFNTIIAGHYVATKPLVTQVNNNTIVDCNQSQATTFTQPVTFTNTGNGARFTKMVGVGGGGGFDIKPAAVTAESAELLRINRSAAESSNPSTNVFKVQQHGLITVGGDQAGNIDFKNQAGTTVAQFSAAGRTWTAFGAGGAMMINSGTGGSYLTLRNYGVKLQDQAGANEIIIRQGLNTPEGAFAAPVGSLFLRTNGGAGTTLYVKESGTGNTGWVAK